MIFLRNNQAKIPIKNQSNSQLENIGLVTSSMLKGNSSIGLALIKSRFLPLEEIDLEDGLGTLTLKDPVGFVQFN